MIEVLWELSHREELSRELVDKALDEMYHIMVDSTVMKDSYKKKYLERCIDSIKKGKVPSIYVNKCTLKHHGRRLANSIWKEIEFWQSVQKTSWSDPLFS